MSRTCKAPRARHFARIAQFGRSIRSDRKAERQSGYAGTIAFRFFAFVAQLAEQRPGTAQVACSIRAEGSNAPVAQMAGGGSLRRSTVQVRILLGAPSLH